MPREGDKEAYDAPLMKKKPGKMVTGKRYQKPEK
jgi:hypothetical protein